MHILARALERPLVVADPLEPLDAIVVLGAPLAPGGLATPILEERAAAAAALYRAGGGARVVVSGGITRGAPRAEAHVLAELLRGHGIEDDTLVLEDVSRTTAENARLVAARLLPLGARRVWIVTQPFHGRRAARLFTRAGLEPRVWHIADSVQYRDRGRARALAWLVREYAAWLRALASRRS